MYDGLEWFSFFSQLVMFRDGLENEKSGRPACKSHVSDEKEQRPIKNA